MTIRGGTVLYDADCGLCTRAADFVRERSAIGTFRFVPLASPAADRLLAGGPPPADTLILFDDEGRHDRSGAALRIAAGLRRPWSWLRALRIVPRPLRNRFYDLVARRRLSWFGPAPGCRPDSHCPDPGRR